MIKVKKYIIPNLILKIKFPEHKKYKKELLKLIGEADDKRWVNTNDKYNDQLFKTDWPEANNWERPWIKLIGDSLFKSLENCAQSMGYTSITAHKIWYQQYAQGDVHNWHIHDGSYTGTYYVEFDKNCSTTEFLYPNDLNKSFTIKVEEGDLLFFPCHLIHRSAVSKSKKMKSIISWNCDFVRIQDKFTVNKTNIEILKEEKNGR